MIVWMAGRRLEGPYRGSEHEKIVILRIQVGWLDLRLVFTPCSLALHKKTCQGRVPGTVGHFDKAAVYCNRRDMLGNVPGVPCLRMVNDADPHTE